jgi:hypothetical protein
MNEREPDDDGFEVGGDLQRTLEAARRAAPAITASRSQTWRWAVLSRLDGRRRRRSPALVAAFAAAAVFALVVWRALAPGPYPVAERGAAPRDQAAAGASADPHVLADGSRVVPDGPATVLERGVESGDDILYELKTGGARFEVARRPSRTFRVHAGPVTVQVIGTRFAVRRFEDRSHVSVTEGRVLISWWGGSRELGAGEEGTFPPQPSPAAGGHAAHAAPAASSTPAPRRAPEPGPEALFAHADRARKAGNPELAVVHLRTLIDRFPADPHAHVAAFTIGRLLLESLHQPRQAAASFERARILARGAPVAEDALAREVEAWAAAGEGALAGRRAELYRQLYPRGSRLAAVLRAGGLEKSAP